MPLLVYACHCAECRRHSGSAFTRGMPVVSNALRMARGAAKAWRRVGPADERTTSWSCGDRCGRTYGEREGMERVNIRAGTLDDTSWLVPVAHYFMRSAQPWERTAGDVEC